MAAVLYTVHFYLLGAFTGSAMNAVGGTRSYIYSKVTPSIKNIWVLLFFTVLAIGATIWTWQGYISILPLLGSSSGAIAYWQSNPKIIRRLAMIAPPLWFTYNAISGSYPGMAIEVIMLTSNIVGQYRFDVRRSKGATRMPVVASELAH
jgi:hypothetical protein